MSASLKPSALLAGILGLGGRSRPRKIQRQRASFLSKVWPFLSFFRIFVSSDVYIVALIAFYPFYCFSFGIFCGGLDIICSSYLLLFVWLIRVARCVTYASCSCYLIVLGAGYWLERFCNYKRLLLWVCLYFYFMYLVLNALSSLLLYLYWVVLSTFFFLLYLYWVVH